MRDEQRSRSITPIRLAGVVVALLACATWADAQVREGRWDFSLGTMYQVSNTLDFEGGSTVDVDDDFGFMTTFGYHFSDSLAATFSLGWAGINYNADVIKDDGGHSTISGSYDKWGTSANLIYHLSEGPLVPYLGAGIGWTWIDTNIPNGLPSTGCWWDPWYGYVCYTTYPTKGTDAFTYQATLGLRYEYNPRSFVRFGYTSQWLDLDNSEGTPRFDAFTLDFGWLF